MLKLNFFNSIHSQIFSSSFLKKKKFAVWLLHFLLLWSFNLKKKKKLQLKKFNWKFGQGLTWPTVMLYSLCGYTYNAKRKKEEEKALDDQGQERAINNQMNIGTILQVTLGKCLRDGLEHIWASPSA